jgi:hypothetical protein
MKIILRRNFEKYDGSVRLDYWQFYMGQRPMAVYLESGNVNGLH